MANWDHAAARVCFDNAVLWWPLMLRPRLCRHRLPADSDAARDVGQRRQFVVEREGIRVLVRRHGRGFLLSSQRNGAACSLDRRQI